MSAPSQTAIESLRNAVLAGQAAEARRHLVALMATHPDDADLLDVAAGAAEACGDMAAAERHLRHLVTVVPHAGWARDELAHFLLRHGRAEEAEAVARATLADMPDDAAAHAFVGQRLALREALPEAIWHLRAAVRHAAPGDRAAILPELGRALLRSGRLDDARALAAAMPASFEASALATEAAEQAGDADAAAAAFARLRTLAAPLGRDVSLLGLCVLAMADRWREALAQLDRLPGEVGGGALLLRGRLRERAGRHAEAWADFVAGKARLARPHDRRAAAATFATLARWPAGLRGAAVRSDVAQPIFVMGMPRSGTTLMEQILSAHPDIRAGGELPFAAELRDAAAAMLGAEGPGGLRIADRHHLPALFRDLYLARADTHGLTQGVRFFTDKMPLNEVYTPLLRLAFPAAPMILMRRHPLDVLVSMMAHDMTHGGNCAYRLDDAAHHLAAVSALVERYRERLSPGFTTVRYERLVADGPTEIARVMAAVGLAQDAAQLAFHRQSRHAPTPSHAQVREPLHTRSVERWRAHASALAPVVPVVAAAMAWDGYEA
ncbi:tetratricopeptide repeat-containing sulfotransferase family protein [Sphingomonas adhaesiva]|uniref:tetratricopeptide repeat-containing sulfotransferase family protein n=1 Tax=Sphingomonas adhaesiva TaxID=28212 RepID=UPI002FFD4B10